MTSALSTLLEVLGLLVLCAGLYLLAPWLGISVAGAGLILLGLALDPPSPRRAPPA